MPNPSLTGPFRKPRSGGAAKQLIIILHGWGADGANLIDLADMLSPHFPEAYFIAPNAPHVCEVNPFGYQWFSLMDRQPQHMLEGVRSAAKVVGGFIDEKLKELGLKEENLALIGFSQGTMVSLQVAIRRNPQIAAVVGFSGALLGIETVPGEIAARPPVCLIHGEVDDVVPFGALKQATDTLKAHGVAVESHPRPFLGHSIDMEGMQIATKFLSGTL